MKYVFLLLLALFVCTDSFGQALDALPGIDEPQDADRIHTYTRGFSAAFQLDTLRKYFAADLVEGLAVDPYTSIPDSLRGRFFTSTSDSLYYVDYYGGFVNLTGGGEAQTVSITNDSLTISSGNTISLPVSLKGDTLSLQGVGDVPLNWLDIQLINTKNNIYIGEGAGRSTTTSLEQGLFVGRYAGEFNQGTNAATFIGSYAGRESQGVDPTIVGYAAGWYADLYQGQVFGVKAGFAAQGDATLLGYRSGFMQSGTGNTSVGKRAAYQSWSSDATAIGEQAGYELSINDTQGTITDANVFPTQDSLTGLSSVISTLGLSVGDRIPARLILSSGTFPSGVSHATVMSYRVATSDAFVVVNQFDNDYTSSGSGTFTFQPVKQYDNVTAIGYGASWNKDNQVNLGNSDTEELRIGDEWKFDVSQSLGGVQDKQVLQWNDSEDQFEVGAAQFVLSEGRIPYGNTSDLLGTGSTGFMYDNTNQVLGIGIGGLGSLKDDVTLQLGRNGYDKQAELNFHSSSGNDHVISFNRGGESVPYFEFRGNNTVGGNDDVEDMGVYTGGGTANTLTKTFKWESDGNTSFEGNRATNMSDPVDAQDGATKSYVDNAVSETQTLDDVTSLGNSTSNSITSTSSITAGSSLPVTLYNNRITMNRAGSSSFIDQVGEGGKIQYRTTTGGVQEDALVMNPSYIEVSKKLSVGGSSDARALYVFGNARITDLTGSGTITGVVGHNSAGDLISVSQDGNGIYSGSGEIPTGTEATGDLRPSGYLGNRFYYAVEGVSSSYHTGFESLTSAGTGFKLDHRTNTSDATVSASFEINGTAGETTLTNNTWYWSDGSDYYGFNLATPSWRVGTTDFVDMPTSLPSKDNQVWKVDDDGNGAWYTLPYRAYSIRNTDYDTEGSFSTDTDLTLTVPGGNYDVEATLVFEGNMSTSEITYRLTATTGNLNTNDGNGYVSLHSNDIIVTEFNDVFGENVVTATANTRYEVHLKGTIKYYSGGGTVAVQFGLIEDSGGQEVTTLEGGSLTLTPQY